MSPSLKNKLSLSNYNFQTLSQNTNRTVEICHKDKPQPVAKHKPQKVTVFDVWVSKGPN